MPEQAAAPRRGWYVAAGLTVAAPVVFLTLPPELARVWYHVVCLGTTAAGAVIVHRSPAADRRPWWCFVGGLGLFSVRDLVMNWVDTSDPHPLEVLVDAVPMAAGYLLLCGATIALVRVRARGRDRDSLVDAAVVAASVATIVWISVASNPDAGINYAITAAHAILQALLFALAVRFMFTGVRSLTPAWLLFLACIFGFVGNVGAVLMRTVEVAPHNWIAASWILAWCCVPLAASHPRMAEVAAPAADQEAVSTARLLVLGAALIGTPLVVLSQIPTTPVGLAAGLGSVLVTLLGLVRVVRLVRALELVRRQQHAVVHLGQLALAGASEDELVAAASAALSSGLDDAQVDVVLGDPVDARATPSQVRHELTVGGERLGAVLLRTGRAVSVPDRTFADAVASTLASSIARSRAEHQVRHWAGELAAQNRELELANQFKIDLMGVLGHEVGNPLSAILLHSEMLAEDLGSEDVDPAEVRHAVGVVGRNARQISHVLNDLLVLVSSDSGALRAQPEPTSLAPLLAAAAESQPPAARPEVDCPPDLVALVQPVHLEQMVGNLLSNAAKYAGGARRLVAASAGEGRVEITVADTGPGVPEGFRPRLFERFSREEELAGKVRGTGLGLFITRELARANGGDVLHRPGESQGSEFIIVLPQTADARTSPGSMAPVERAGCR